MEKQGQEEQGQRPLDAQQRTSKLCRMEGGTARKEEALLQGENPSTRRENCVSRGVVAETMGTLMTHADPTKDSGL